MGVLKIDTTIEQLEKVVLRGGEAVRALRALKVQLNEDLFDFDIDDLDLDLDFLNDKPTEKVIEKVEIGQTEQKRGK